MCQVQRLKEELDYKAKAAINKLPEFGTDVDLSQFNPESSEKDYPKNLNSAGDKYSDTLLKAGIDLTQKDRLGTFLQMDHNVIHAASNKEGLEVMSITDALKKYDWLWD